MFSFGAHGFNINSVNIERERLTLHIRRIFVISSTQISRCYLLFTPLLERDLYSLA